MSIKIFGCYICPCRSYWKSRVRWSSWDGVPLAWWKSNWTPPQINLLRTGTLEGIESQRKPVRSYPITFSETFWLIFTSILVQCTRMSKKPTKLKWILVFDTSSLEHSKILKTWNIFTWIQTEFNVLNHQPFTDWTSSNISDSLRITSRP